MIGCSTLPRIKEKVQMKDNIFLQDATLKEK